jgi:hypothetical protein
MLPVEEPPPPLSEVAQYVVKYYDRQAERIQSTPAYEEWKAECDGRLAAMLRAIEREQSERGA